MFMLARYVLAIVLFVYHPFVLADSLSPTIPNTKTTIELFTITATEYDKLPSAEQQMLASQWHLTVPDYSHYLWLMNNTPNGWYYRDQHLDPSWILGFNAATDQERQKYALIAIQNERAKVEKEFAFQRAFVALQKALYPNQLPIEDHPLSPVSVTHAGG